MLFIPYLIPLLMREGMSAIKEKNLITNEEIDQQRKRKKYITNERLQR